MELESGRGNHLILTAVSLSVCGLHIYSTPLLNMREWLSLKQLQFEWLSGLYMLEPGEKTAICIQLLNKYDLQWQANLLHVVCMFGSMYQSHSSPLLQCVPYLQWYLLGLAGLGLIADHTLCRTAWVCPVRQDKTLPLGTKNQRGKI